MLASSLVLTSSCLLGVSTAWVLPKRALLRGSLYALKNSQTDHGNVYSQPALYDMAFSYRDYDEEVDFLLEQHRHHTGQSASTVLDLMAGPARHSLSALGVSEVSTVFCIDNEPAMVDYAKSLLAEEYDQEEQQGNFDYQVADVRSFQLPSKADTAWIVLGSFQHMLHFRDAVNCLSAVRSALHDKKSTLFIELPHPRELFRVIDCTTNEWTVPMELSDGTTDELRILWGDAENDPFDPVTQIRQHSVSMQLKSNATTAVVSTQVPLRSFTAQEMEALAALTGFRVAAWYGALEEGVGIDDEEAFRMVCCLCTV